MVSKRFLGLALLGSLIALGCGGPDAKSPHALHVKSPFPSKAKLDKLASAPIKPLPSHPVVAVPEVRLEGDVPESSLAETRLAEVASDLRFTKELRCAARELGRLRVEHGGDTDERVNRFVAGACGITSPAGVSMYHVTGEAPADVSDAKLLDAWKTKVQVPASFRGKPLGAWLARKGKQAVLMLVTQPQLPVVEVTRSTNGHLVVRGMTSPDAAEVLGLINQGRDGVARCEADLSVALPSYAFDCAMAEGDPWAWLEIATRPNDRLLMRSTALVLARRDPTAPLELSARSAESSGSTDLPATVLEGVNRARRGAKLEPVTLATQQSAVNGRLAGHFFTAEGAGEGGTSDIVALGLLAGWDVAGMIRNGSFFGTMLSGTASPSAWLDFALEHPMGRFTLLQADTRQIAVGAAPADSAGGLGVVITSYAFFGAENHDANAARVMTNLGKARAARRLPPVKVLGALPALSEEARLVNAGKHAPMEALDNALGAESQRIGASMRGWAVVTNDLDSVPFPKELLAPGVPTVRIVVTHYRPEDAAWGAYLVYFAGFVPAGQQQVASTRAIAPRL